MQWQLNCVERGFITVEWLHQIQGEDAGIFQLKSPLISRHQPPTESDALNIHS